MIENKFAKKVVEAIQLGLKRAKIAEMENGDRFNNAKSSKIIDKMMSSLYSNLSLDGRLEVYELYRGSYKLLLVYCRGEHRLYSFMSENRMNSLINSKKREDKKNYIFALIKLNPGERQQQTLFQETDIVLDGQKKIIEKVREIINEDDNIEYITFLYDKKGYNLLNVRAVKMSQYAELIESQDLSDYIAVDYDDVYENANNDSIEATGDLEISLKKEILTQSEDVDIKPNNENIRKEEDNE